MADHFTTDFVHPNRRYEPVKYLEGNPITHISLLGGGTYGEVYQGELNNFPIAVKRNIIEKSIDGLGSIRELDILSSCKHPFIVDLVAIFLSNPFKNYILPEITQFKTDSGMVDLVKPIKIPAPDLKEDPLFFGFESAAYDFQTFIHNCTEKSWPYIKKAMVQLLIAMKWLHAKGIIHRDLKPSNLLWQRDGCERFLKICDFGMSKHMYETGIRSSRVVTSWYRAPEISFGYPYSYPSDMWSIGCILYEIVTKIPLNNKIVDDNVKLLENSLSIISEIPDRNLVNKMNKMKLVLDEKIYHNRCNIETILNSQSNNSLRYYYNNFDKDNLGNRSQFADLLNKILVLDPVKRFTASQCLNHPFFNGFRSYIDKVEKIYPPIEPVYEKINIVECKDRKIAAHICYKIFDDEDKFAWYKPQILFHTLEIYDKYLTYMQQTNAPYHEVGPNKEDCSYESEKMITFKILVCLYICIKYFTITKVAGKFTDILLEKFHTPEYLNIAKEFEAGLILTLLKYQIYRPTILEASDYYRVMPNRSNIKYMLMYYGSLKGGIYENYRALFPGYQKFESEKLEEKRLARFVNPTGTFPTEMRSPQEGNNNGNQQNYNQQNYVQPQQNYPNIYQSYPIQQNYNPNVNPNINYNNQQQNYNPNMNYNQGYNNSNMNYNSQQNYNQGYNSQQNFNSNMNYNPNVNYNSNPNPNYNQGYNNSNMNYYNQQNYNQGYNSQQNHNPTFPKEMRSPQESNLQNFSPNKYPTPSTPGTPINNPNVNNKVLMVPKQGTSLREKPFPISSRPKISIVHTTHNRYTNQLTSPEISPGLTSSEDNIDVGKIITDNTISPLINNEFHPS